MKKIASHIFTTVLLFLACGVLISLLLSLVPDYERYELSTWRRFLENLGTFMTFRYGDAVVEQYPIFDILCARGVKTALLIAGALILTLGISIPLGIHAARHKEHKRARFIDGMIYGLSSVPILVWATLLLIFFQRTMDVFLHWQLLSNYPLGWRLMIYLLPMICLALGDGMLADMTRHIRDEAVKLLEQDFVRSLRARNVLVMPHLCRGLIPTVMAVIAGKIAYLFGGAIVVEYIFGWQGLGFALYGAVSRPGSKDYPLILAATMLFVAAALLINLLSSLSAIWADPRLRKD